MIAGLCRFSFLSEDGGGGWKTAAEALFDDARLETRFRLFERYTLPSIRGQTDGDFRFIVLTSSEMPKPQRDRLMDITSGDRAIKVLPLPVQKVEKAIKAAFRQEFGRADPQVSFRVDDDDGLSVNFVRRLREAAGARGLGDPFYVSFGRGIVVMHEGDRVAWASECAYPFFSAGMALVASKAQRRYVYSFGHLKCHRRFDGLVLSGAPAFIRCLHGHNDGKAELRGTTRGYARTSLAELARTFGKEFPYLADAC
jgi:hypothetical protein